MVQDLETTCADLEQIISLGRSFVKHRSSCILLETDTNIRITSIRDPDVEVLDLAKHLNDGQTRLCIRIHL